MTIKNIEQAKDLLGGSELDGGEWIELKEFVDRACAEQAEATREWREQEAQWAKQINATAQ